MEYENNIKSIEHNGSFIPVVDGMLLTMPQGGAIKYSTKLQAENHSRRYGDGYTGGAFKANKEDVI